MPPNNAPLPSLAELQKYNVNVPGQMEGIRQSLYDFTAYPTAGVTSLTLFQTPIGQSGKTKADTNMEIAGSLPAPKNFLVESIEMFFFSGALPSVYGAGATAKLLLDQNAIFKSGYLEFFIGSKTYLTEAPLGRFPPMNALHGVAALSDTTTAAGAQASVIDYFAAAGRPYEMNPPILLVPTQNFNINLNWPTAVATPSGVDGRIGIVMRGILYRNSQ